MSGASSIHTSLRAIPTAEALKSEQIVLIDQERRGDAAQDDDAEHTDGSEPPTAPPTPGPSPLTKKLTTNSLQLQQSLKREWTKRKYAKYDRGRYKINDPSDTPDPSRDGPPDETPSSQPQHGEEATPQQTSYLERSRAKARDLLHRKRTLGAGTHSTDSVLDILYENQRGFFLCGVPRYSASTLLPSDPKPWQNAQFRTSPVDIRNAQVPDPSWEWAWKGWYVDMSRDVDEEGWEYSFQFNGGFAWHGSHPWFHSFVRRRRWVRMRRRRRVVHRTKEKSHELTAEYFTIHPKTLRRGGEGDDMSGMAESELTRLLREKEDEAVDVEKMEITDIGSLELALRKAAVDREKVVAVRKFVNDAGDELFYLSERMPEIMGLFVYQSSRRQLLADLLQRYDETSKQKESLMEHSHGDDEAAKKDHDAAAKRADNLMKAVQAADEQVKRLEYWSDIKGLAQQGDTLHEGQWDGEKWQGLSSPVSDHPVGPFQSKQDASEGVQELHSHPEHGDSAERAPEKKESSVFYDAKTQTKDSSEDTQGAYSTAAESLSQIPRTPTRPKGKARAVAAPSSLDGVLETDAQATAGDMVDASAQTEDEEIDPETGLTFMTPPERAMTASAAAEPKTPNSAPGTRQEDVQNVEPEPIPDDAMDLPSPALKSGEGS